MNSENVFSVFFDFHNAFIVALNRGSTTWSLDDMMAVIKDSSLLFNLSQLCAQKINEYKTELLADEEHKDLINAINIETDKYALLHGEPVGSITRKQLHEMFEAVCKMELQMLIFNVENMDFKD